MLSVCIPNLLRRSESPPDGSYSTIGGVLVCAALEIDNDLKPHVQQRSPSVIFRPEVSGPLQCIRELRQRVSRADPG